MVVRVEVVGKSGLSVRHHFLLPALGAMVVVVIYSRGAYGRGGTAVGDDCLLPTCLAYGSCNRGMCSSQNLAVLLKRHDNSHFLHS